jgi:hypothetical protein
MSNQMYVRDISSLRDLKISLKKFSENSITILSNIESKINQELSYLKSKEHLFLNALREAEDNLREAESSLRYCQSQGYYERDDDGNEYWVEPDCSTEESWVAECARISRIAKDKYQRCKQTIWRVKNQISLFEAEKVKFQRLIINHNENSVSVLTQLINGVEDYKAIQTPVTNIHSEPSQKNILLNTSLQSAANVISNLPVYHFEAKNKQQFEISNSVGGSNISFNILQNGRSIMGSSKSCGNIKIKEKNGQKGAQIVNISTPNAYKSMGVGEHILKNMENIARQNDCAEISGWADAHEIDFYLRQGYSIRNQISNVGGEIYKAFSGKDEFAETQDKIRATFAGFNQKLLNKEYRLEKSQLVNNIDPKKILSPEIDEKFWDHHGNRKDDYIKLIKDSNTICKRMKDGESIKDIEKTHISLINAYEVCTKNPIRLIKLNDYYMVDEDGRHRVAAAQSIDENVKLTADVREAKKSN